MYYTWMILLSLIAEFLYELFIYIHIHANTQDDFVFS